MVRCHLNQDVKIKNVKLKPKLNSQLSYRVMITNRHS